MPGIDGIETCKRLRSMPCASEIPIVILTGRDDEKYINEAYKFGATDYLLKPINWLLLKERISAVLNDYDVRRELVSKQDELNLAQKVARIVSLKIDCVTKDIELSPMSFELLGISSEHNIISFDDMLKIINEVDRSHYRFSVNQAINDKDPCLVEFSVMSKEGNELILFQKCEYIQTDGNDSAILSGLIQDVTQSRRLMDDIETKRYSDDVTNLPNKRYFELQIEHLLHNPPIDKLFCVVFIGLDKFSRINDMISRSGGDRVLQIIALRLKQFETDGCIVCRYSGDIFAILINNISHIDTCNQILDDIQLVIHKELVVDSESIFMKASIGASVFPLESESAESLLNGAEAAMMSSREEGGNRYTYRTVDMNKRTQYRNLILKDMRSGLLNDEFINYYQPQLDSKTLKIVGMEALARWQHPKKGMISPAEFIPLAEESGLIIGLGEKILRKACSDTARWNAMGHELRVSVNLSAHQFEMDKICELIEQVLKEEKLDPHYLEVEITESMAVSDYVSTRKKLETLRELGIKTSMDDFGTGYSSLSQLQEMPLDTLKVDQAFVRCISLDNTRQGDQRYRNSAIANAIIAMSHSLELTVIAEGVETIEQCEFLQEKGSDILQGFLFSKPISAEEFEKLIFKK